MSILDRLRSAYEAFWGREWPPNMGHKYAVRTLDTTFYADRVEVNPLTGYPEWWVSCPGYNLHCIRGEVHVTYEYEVLE